MSQSAKGRGMNRRDFMKTTGIILAAGAVLRAVPAAADKSSVRIVAPEAAAAGEEITIELHVSHSANSFFHYTNRVNLLINGQEAQRWTYSSGSRPESADFVVKAKHTLSAPIQISAEAFCNIHGTAGPAQAAVALRQT